MYGQCMRQSPSADNVTSVEMGCLADITTRRQESRHALSTIDKDGHVADVMTNHPSWPDHGVVKPITSLYCNKKQKPHWHTDNISSVIDQR